jgi:hypothetical protein
VVRSSFVGRERASSEFGLLDNMSRSGADPKSGGLLLDLVSLVESEAG